MVNTPSLPVVVPHGDDSNVYVLFAASSSGLQRWAVAAALHCATRQRTAMTQTEPPAASCAATSAPAPVIECVAPAPAREGSSRWKRHLARPEYVGPAPDVTDTAPTPVIEHVAPVPFFF